MVYSPIHEMEISGISDDDEREDLLYLIDKIAVRMEQAGTHTRKRAEDLVNQGFGTADAAHLAYAEKAQAVFIPSCNQDDFSGQYEYHSKFGKPSHRKKSFTTEDTEVHRARSIMLCLFLCEPL